VASKSLEEIEQQIKVLQAEAEDLRLAEGIEQLRVVIRKYKVGLPHFRIALGADKKRKSSSRKLSPTHRNPNNPAETWTGRGRKPRWLVAALDAGNTVEECRIGRSTLPDAVPTHQTL
jgi:DNA-binding protein H-NS